MRNSGGSLCHQGDKVGVASLYISASLSLHIYIYIYIYDNSTDNKHNISQPVTSQASCILWLHTFMLLQWQDSGLYIKIMLKENIKNLN